MMRRFLSAFTNVLVAGFAIDAAISFLCLFTDSEMLASVRNTVAFFVLIQSLFAIFLLGLTRKLPLSVILPVAISSLVLNIGLIPFVYVVERSVLEAWAVVVQCLIAVAVYFRVHSLHGGQSWQFELDWFSGRLFSWPYFLGYELVASTLLIASIVLFAVSSLVIGVGSVTKGFVRIDSEGISLADRVYENQGRRIRLVGMMHIGEDEGYRRLFHDLGRGTASMLVLTEGVSDAQGLLVGGLSYGALAKALGVGEQQAIEDYVDWEERADHDLDDSSRPVFVNADLDLSDFDPRTIELLEEVGELYRGDGFLNGFLEIYERMRANPDASAAMTEDLIGRRNRYVIAQISDHKEDYREIVVPWGAMHLPGIATAIEELGFVRRSTRYIQFISWQRVMDALASGREKETSFRSLEGGAPGPVIRIGSRHSGLAGE